jgi:eukaryotic-like serine/threonine-protein kinase
VFDAGEAQNRYYMCMEYVHGKDLEQIWERFRIKGAVMDPYVAAHIAAEILRGLDYVHRAKTPNGRELGLVHRDCTPSNVYVSSTGHIKLGDFGVAKLLGVERFTMAGSIKGKLGYLSPEQVAGESPTQAIDLWAAAIILFEMASGARALTGENELDIMLRIKAAKIPALRKTNKAAPKPLEKILDRALHRKLKKRYPNAAAILEDLAKFQATGPKYEPATLVQYLTNALR